MDMTKKAIAKMDLERFGRVVFKKGTTYQFKEEMTSEGKILYRIKTITGDVEFLDKDLTKFFFMDGNQA